jgi:hypothetical protein
MERRAVLWKGREDTGITVYPIYFARHNEDGVPIRCSTRPLVRKLRAE